MIGTVTFSLRYSFNAECVSLQFWADWVKFEAAQNVLLISASPVEVPLVTLMWVLVAMQTFPLSHFFIVLLSQFPVSQSLE